MLLVHLSLAFGQSAPPPEYSASEADDSPNGPSDLSPAGYCQDRAIAMNNEVAFSTGSLAGVWGKGGWEAKSDGSGKFPVDIFAAKRSAGQVLCVEVTMSGMGDYTARADLAMKRAHSLMDQLVLRGGNSPELVVTFSEPAEKPVGQAGTLVWASWGEATTAKPVAAAPANGGWSMAEWSGALAALNTPSEVLNGPVPAARMSAAPPAAAAVADPVASRTQPVISPPVTPVMVKASASAVVPSVPVSSAMNLPSIDGRLATGQSAKNDAAVVIGLEDYAFVPDVPYARRDAEAFYNFLLYTRGVPRERITMLSAGSVEHVRKAVQDAGKSVSAGGTVWVYFAGHGAASPTSREQVILGDDVRPDDVSFDARSVAVSDVQRMASAGGGTAMLVLDACFSGVGRDGASLLGGHRTLIPAQAVHAVETARQWSATSAGEAAVPLDSVQHGAFTYAAIGALRGWADGEFGTKDGKVTADEADAYVARLLRAMQVREQTPQFVGGREIVLSQGAKETGPLVE